MLKFRTFLRYLLGGMIIGGEGICMIIVQSLFHFYRQQKDALLRQERRQEDINLWNECLQNGTLRASERCQRVIDGSSFDLRNLKEAQEGEVWLQGMLSKGNHYFEEYGSSVWFEYFIYFALIIGAYTVFYAVGRVEEGTTMSAKTEAKNNLTLIGREITQWEEEITKKEEVIAKKERDIAEKQKDLDFRAEKKAQEYISKVLPAMLQEQRTLLSGRPWPPVEEGGVPRASEPEARVVRASRPRRGPR